MPKTFIVETQGPTLEIVATGFEVRDGFVHFTDPGNVAIALGQVIWICEKEAELLGTVRLKE